MMPRFALRRLAAIACAVALLLGAGVALAAVWLFRGDGVRVALEQQAAAQLGQPVSIGAASVQFYPRVGLSLTDVQIGRPVRIRFARGSVSTGLRSLLSRKIVDGNVLLADSDIALPLPPLSTVSPAPSEGGSGKPGTPPSPSLTVESISRISLSNISLTSRGRRITISGESSLAGSLLTITSMTVATEHSAVAVRARVFLEPSLTVDADLSAKALDLDDLVALAAAFSPAPATARGSASTPGVRLTARVSAASAKAAGLELEALTSVVRLAGTRLSLSPTGFRAFGGRYDGDLDIDMRDSAVMKLTTRLTGIDVARLAAFGGADGAVTGRLSANATVTGRGTDLASVLSSARGSGNVSIVDGTIRRLNLLRTVVVFFGRPAPASPPASDRFSRMDARIALADGMARADAFSMTSPDADIAGQGSLNLRTTALDGHLDLSLSEALSQEAGTDFARYTREGNRIVLPANIGGSLSEPKLSIDASAALRRGLRNELDRRMRGLLDRFSGGQ